MTEHNCKPFQNHEIHSNSPTNPCLKCSGILILTCTKPDTHNACRVTLNGNVVHFVKGIYVHIHVHLQECCNCMHSNPCPVRRSLIEFHSINAQTWKLNKIIKHNYLSLQFPATESAKTNWISSSITMSYSFAVKQYMEMPLVWTLTINRHTHIIQHSNANYLT